MLTLHLTLTNGQVSVRANGKESHQFSLLDLSQSEKEWKDFFKNPRPYGEKLFNALFRDAALTEFNALSTERTIVLVLESSALDQVAWEYAYNTVKEEYVVEEHPFVRALPENERPANGKLKASYERVPLLFIPANPLVDMNGEPMQALDVDGEWKVITRYILTSNAPFDLYQLRPASPEDLQTIMANFRHGLMVHFSGHGAATNDGTILLFEEHNGRARIYAASEFVRTVKDQAMIVFLSACQSAVAGKTEFSNLARQLVGAGVPFALGMQFNLPDKYDDIISQQFYNYLARGYTIPEATMQARRALKNEAKKTGDEFFVGMIALYAAHPDETGNIKWSGAGAQVLNTFRPADVSDLPSPASGLIGRQRELMRIGARLLEAKKPLTVTLHGAGGIGKTALLWQTLLRFAPSFDLTLALALDPLPSLESVLGRIERFVGLPSPCSNDTKEREAIVRNALTSKHALLGLDNFETLNHALNDEAQKATAKSLYAFFKSLPAAGVTLCVTSREKTQLPGEHIEEIYGLEDAMGGALFYENVSTRKDALNETGLQKLSAAVGGHPLALRLLAPIFEEQAGLTLNAFTEKLQTFLPKASDQWTEQDRHASLGACFAFSMDNLPKDEEGKYLQIALARLSVFIAFFVDFTSAPVLENGFPETDELFSESRKRASNVLHALWERGLLERAMLPLENENFYLYRLHPALGFFAKAYLTDEETVTARENYWQAMSNLARMAEEQIKKSPLMAQITYRAIPDLIFSSGFQFDRDGALMRHRVSILLQQFGLYDDSIRLLNNSLEILENIGDLQGKSATLHQMAGIYVTRGDLDGAMKLYAQSLEIKEGLGDLQGKSATLHQMAGIYVTRGDLDGAMKLYAQSLEIKEGLGDLQGKSATLHEMAYIYVTRGDLDGAMKLYAQSQAIDEGLGDLQGKSATLHQMAGIYVTRGDLDGAMKLYAQSQAIDEGLGDLQGKSATLHQMAGIYVTRGDLDGAMKLYAQSLEIKEGLGDLQGKSATLHQMAGIYVTRGDLDGAMKLYAQSLEIKEGLGDLQGKSATLHEMAYIYVTRGDLDGAMKLYAQSLEIKEGLGDLQGKSATLHEMAYIYVTRGDLDGAMKLYAQSQAIDEGLGDLQGKSATLHQMAGIYVTRGDLDGAMKLYQQSLEIKEGLGDLKGKASTLAMLGQLLVVQKEYPRAIMTMVESLQTLSSIGARPDAEKVAEILAGVRQQIGEETFDSAWKEVIASPLPDWLKQERQNQGMTAEQFIAGAIQSAREKRPEAEQYFKQAQKMATDSNAPQELQALGRVLQKIMVGDTKVNLSELPAEWAELITKIHNS